MCLLNTIMYQIGYCIINWIVNVTSMQTVICLQGMILGKIEKAVLIRYPFIGWIKVIFRQPVNTMWVVDHYYQVKRGMLCRM